MEPNPRGQESSAAPKQIRPSAANPHPNISPGTPLHPPVKTLALPADAVRDRLLLTEPPSPRERPTPVRVAVIGGDARMRFMSEALLGAGCDVYACASGDGYRPARIHLCTGWEKAVEPADLLVLPLPVSRDGMTVFCPADPTARIELSALAQTLRMRPDLRLLGGRFPPSFLSTLPEELCPRVIDYYEDETLQLRNAAVTAEAALLTALEQADGLLRGAPVTVIGYGRIGQILADLLRGIGAAVTIAARRADSRAWAEIRGCTACPLTGEGAAPPDDLPAWMRPPRRVIFNTVPAPVITPAMLRAMDPRTLILDLASAPGGFSPDVSDTSAPASNSLTSQKPSPRILRLPSLPGRYAPREAGEIIAETVLRLAPIRPHI